MDLFYILFILACLHVHGVRGDIGESEFIHNQLKFKCLGGRTLLTWRCCLSKRFEYFHLKNIFYRTKVF